MKASHPALEVQRMAVGALSLLNGIALGLIVAQCAGTPRQIQPAPDPLAPGQESALRYAIWVLSLPTGPVLGPDGRLPDPTP